MGKRKNIGRKMKKSTKDENCGRAKQLEKYWRDKEGGLVEQVEKEKWKGKIGETRRK